MLSVIAARLQCMFVFLALSISVVCSLSKQYILGEFTSRFNVRDDISAGIHIAAKWL